MTHIDNKTTFLNNMLAVLECNGLLFVNDIGNWRPDFRKASKVKVTEKIATYKESADRAIEIHRTC
jgi:putative aminopeptidase FrvX